MSVARRHPRLTKQLNRLATPDFRLPEAGVGSEDVAFPRWGTQI